MFRKSIGLAPLIGRALRVSGSRVAIRTMSVKDSDEFEPEPMLPADYPQVPLENFQRRNPWIYDDQQDRRNFDEPLSDQDEILTVWGPDVYDYPAGRALFELLCVAGFIGTTAYLYSYIAPQSPAVPRSFPFDGLRVELGNDPNSTVNSRAVVNMPGDDE